MYVPAMNNEKILYNTLVQLVYLGRFEIQHPEIPEQFIVDCTSHK